MEKIYDVTGMSCSHCVAAVRDEVGALPGVSDVAVELSSGRVTVRGDQFTDAEVETAVEEAGYALARS